MSVFNKFYSEVENYENTHEIKIVKVDPQNSPVFNNTVLLKNIKDIPNMEKNELLNFVRIYFSSILTNASNGNPDDILAFTNIDLLNAIISLLYKREIQIQDTDIIKFNALTYQYLTIPDDNPVIKKDQAIIDKLFDISEYINEYWLPRLKGLGLSKTLANTLIIARFSNITMKIVVNRINFIIINQPPELMSQKLILEIFKILYDVGKEWSMAFTYFMEDVPYIDPRYPNSEDMEEVNSTMELAALELLNELPTDYLYSALINYAQTYAIMNIINIRFSMQHLSDDFNRINDAIYSLKYEKNCIVP